MKKPQRTILLFMSLLMIGCTPPLKQPSNLLWRSEFFHLRKASIQRLAFERDVKGAALKASEAWEQYTTAEIENVDAAELRTRKGEWLAREFDWQMAELNLRMATDEFAAYVARSGSTPNSSHGIGAAGGGLTAGISAGSRIDPAWDDPALLQASEASLTTDIRVAAAETYLKIKVAIARHTSLDAGRSGLSGIDRNSQSLVHSETAPAASTPPIAREMPSRGVLITDWQPIAGKELGLGLYRRRWLAEARHIVSVIPDINAPSSACRVSVMPEVRERPNENYPWRSGDPELARNVTRKLFNYISAMSTRGLKP